MRLIDADALAKRGDVKFEVWPEYAIPKYAILSHRWGDHEVTLQELTSKDPHEYWFATQKTGYHKIYRAAVTAVDYKFKWLWCDTCCIDKTSSAELSEAINSMYRWYRGSDLCLAQLSDFPSFDVPIFTQSVWFTRAWTLQELIAPPKLIFFDNTWKSIGTKHQLVDAIAQRTRIDRDVLNGDKRLEKITVAQRMSWAADRVAGRTEDIAYSLLGIFDVNMPMLYGEGKKAFLRLQEEIMQRSADQSIFVWFPAGDSSTIGLRQTGHLFATSPADFAQCHRLQQQNQKKKAFTINNLGLDIELTLQPTGLDTYLAYLAVESGGPNYLASLAFEVDPETGLLCRTGSSLERIHKRAGPQMQQTRRVTVLRSASTRHQHSTAALFGFHLATKPSTLRLVNNWDPMSEWDLGEWQLGDSPNHFRFFIPPGVTASIAMLTLSLSQRVTLLIQLGYDFDFNPCCHISKMTLDFQERFGRRSKLDAGEDDSRFAWLNSIPSTQWVAGMRHQYTEVVDPLTTQRYWICKSVDRQEFTATIPTHLTKPHTNLAIKFSILTHSNREWQFEIDTSSMPDFLHQSGNISIIDVKADAEQEVLKRRTPDPDDPAEYLRHASYKDHKMEIKMKGLLGPGMNARMDTSPI